MSEGDTDRQKTILVVEDDPLLRTFYRSALMIAGYGVISAEDGMEALRRLDQGAQPDLVTLDMALPRVSGREVLQELKARPNTHHLPIMVVSGTDTRDLSPEDVACVMRKPVTATQFITAVEDCLRSVDGPAHRVMRWS